MTDFFLFRKIELFPNDNEFSVVCFDRENQILHIEIKIILLRPNPKIYNHFGHTHSQQIARAIWRHSCPERANRHTHTHKPYHSKLRCRYKANKMRFHFTFLCVRMFVDIYSNNRTVRWDKFAHRNVYIYLLNEWSAIKIRIMC